MIMGAPAAHQLARITVGEGPYIVEGPVAVMDADHTPIGTPSNGAIALCRCGASANKPLCDGSHATVGFDGAINPTSVSRPLSTHQEGKENRP